MGVGSANLIGDQGIIISNSKIKGFWGKEHQDIKKKTHYF